MCNLTNRGQQGKTQNMEKCRHFCSDTKKDKLENKEYKLVSYKELPGYMKDNEFIHKYYRVEWPFKQAFFSLFQWHNETINVWRYLLLTFQLYFQLFQCYVWESYFHLKIKNLSKFNVW